MANWQSIDELQDIASDLPRFTHALDELSRRLGLNITPLTADHISLRCHQNVTAERWRRGFEQCGELLSENMITRQNDFNMFPTFVWVTFFPGPR